MAVCSMARQNVRQKVLLAGKTLGPGVRLFHDQTLLLITIAFFFLLL